MLCSSSSLEAKERGSLANSSEGERGSRGRRRRGGGSRRRGRRRGRRREGQTLLLGLHSHREHPQCRRLRSRTLACLVLSLALSSFRFVIDLWLFVSLRPKFPEFRTSFWTFFFFFCFFLVLFCFVFSGSFLRHLCTRKCLACLPWNP